MSKMSIIYGLFAEGLGSGVERVEEVEKVSGVLTDSSVFAVAVVHWPILMKDHKYPSGSSEDQSRD